MSRSRVVKQCGNSEHTHCSFCAWEENASGSVRFQIGAEPWPQAAGGAGVFQGRLQGARSRGSSATCLLKFLYSAPEIFVEQCICETGMHLLFFRKFSGGFVFGRECWC